MEMFKTLTKPVTTCRAESGTLSKGIAKWLATFVRNVLRKVFWGIEVNKNQRKRYNN
jgi:hypothetical protein